MTKTDMNRGTKEVECLRRIKFHKRGGYNEDQECGSTLMASPHGAGSHSMADLLIECYYERDNADSEPYKAGHETGEPAEEQGVPH